MLVLFVCLRGPWGTVRVAKMQDCHRAPNVTDYLRQAYTPHRACRRGPAQVHPSIFLMAGPFPRPRELENAWYCGRMPFIIGPCVALYF